MALEQVLVRELVALERVWGPVLEQAWVLAPVPVPELGWGLVLVAQ